MKKQQLDYDYLIVRYLNNTISKSDKEELSKWVAASSANKKCFIQKIKIWELSAISCKKIDSSHNYHPFFYNHIINTIKYFSEYKIVACLALCVVSLLLIQTISAKNEQIIISSGDFVKTIILPDSSTVWLNSNTTIKYPKHFTAKRYVELDGEGYFCVTKDSKKQFVVQTPNVSINVYGTRFFICDRKKLGEVQTVLESGSVGMTDNFSDQEYTMEPNQEIRLNKETKEIAISEVNPQDYVFWSYPSLQFHNMPLSEVLKSLSDRYNIKFICEDKKLLSKPITITIDNEKLEEVLDVIGQVCSYHWKFVDKNEIFIKQV